MLPEYYLFQSAGKGIQFDLSEPPLLVFLWEDQHSAELISLILLHSG
jgi:hypothetical protein